MTFAVRDEEWMLLSSYMPTKTHNSGSETDWRAIVDALIVKWNLPNCAWRKLPHSSRIRMAFYRSIEFGTWAEVERALPNLNLSRTRMFKAICIAARRVRMGRR